MPAARPGPAPRPRTPVRGARPPGPSAIQPTTVGPAIWPAANTIVKALMPAAHSEAGRLCRTSAVVDATTERNTPPNSRPDSSTSGHAVVSAGHDRGQRQQDAENGQGLAAPEAIEQAGPDARRSQHRQPQQRIEQGDPRRPFALLAQQRDHESHVADVADAEHEIAGQPRRESPPTEAQRRAREPRRRSRRCGALLHALQHAHRPGQHGRRDEAGQRQPPPGPGPAVGTVARGFQQSRHHQRRQHDAQAGSAVVQAQQQAAARGLQRHQPGGEQAAGDEQKGARHPGQHALQQQRRRAR